MLTKAVLTMVASMEARNTPSISLRRTVSITKTHDLGRKARSYPAMLQRRRHPVRYGLGVKLFSLWSDDVLTSVSVLSPPG